ncbi:hypothetical protein [Quadrisphaera sp. INWT6]|uniref:hypothetical protein n=1 Tax=Quadrisphaera sp. INWT6 TaxID=2596917 RepID=UPI00189205DD|nr:hypothetical protein [Quadrisphaera sp. INWT6]MBF5080362.1 hypothetical protein [Quadrisphaera sp. INWT6]
MILAASRTAARAGAAAARGRRAGGAFAAQASQAAASLALQVLVARELGASGLSRWALLYGGLVLVTGVMTGLVGDTLTVVDRQQRPVRAALQQWTLAGAVVLATAVTAVGAAPAGLALAGAAALWLSVALFLLEDTSRRLLMACGRFWSVVVVDGAALAGSMAVVGAVALVGGPLDLTTFFWALAAGQGLACGAAVLLLPRQERWLAGWRGADRRVVLGFGAWRAAQQTLRPGSLTLARVVVVAAAGAAAYGSVEAARLLVTPLVLLVGGAGNLLLVRFAGSGSQDRRAARRTADRAAVALLGVSVVAGGTAVALVPLVGDLVTGGSFAVSRAAVGGWVAYAATASLVLPYATLAAVRGHQASAFALRAVDSAASVGLVALLVALGAGAWTMPWALASGSLVSAAVLRWRVLASGRERSADAPAR